jgi:RNA-directed DNA polymerase
LRELQRFLERHMDLEVQEGWEHFSPKPILLDSGKVPGPVFRPLVPLLETLDLPELATTRQLAEWLEVSIGRLEWLAGQYRGPPGGRFDRFELRWRHTGDRSRLLEIPRPLLKQLQRRVLEGLLSRVPPHPCAHGFRRGRSVRSYVAPHVRQAVVWKTDLANFFPSIFRPRVFGLFRLLGYPEKVADLFAGLTTHRVDPSVLDQVRGQVPGDAFHELELLLPQAHLPPGAPTSPALANLVAYRLDSRLHGLARSFGAVYTRYADDLAFSGDHRFKRSLQRFRVNVLAIILDEGFSIRRRKSSVMTGSRRQQVAGVVVNEKPNVPREQYKTLKAILHNCIVFGAESQNRDHHTDFRAHLLGRIEFVRSFHPERGRKLRDLFDQIRF